MIPNMLYFASDITQMPSSQLKFHFEKPLPAVEALKGTRMTSRQAKKEYNERQRGSKMTWEEEQELIKRNKMEDAAERKMLKDKESKEMRAAKAKKTREAKKAEARRQQQQRQQNKEPTAAKWAIDEPARITGYFKAVSSGQVCSSNLADTAYESDDFELPTIQELCAEYQQR